MCVQVRIEESGESDHKSYGRKKQMLKHSFETPNSQ